jgi:hypothetical protein
LAIKSKQENSRVSRWSNRENLSSSVLFTFTPKIEFLLEFLNVGITPRYAFERLPGSAKAYIAPMKCFCDIPLGKVKYHMERYGYYGVGLKKSFLRKHGATPVIYVHSNSRMLKNISKGKILKKEYKSILPLLKRYDGDDYCYDINGANHTKKRIYFYDEKEWRYLPPQSEYEIITLFEKIDSGLRKATTMNVESPYFKYVLRIPLDAIEYIIIRKERELDGIIQIVKENYTASELNMLLTKVLTAENILKDF